MPKGETWLARGWVSFSRPVPRVGAGPEPTGEDVAEHWATINDENGYFVPADLMSWSAAFLTHLS